MKKVFLLIIFALLLTLPVTAAQSAEDILNEQYENSGAFELFENLPDNAKEEMENLSGEKPSLNNVKDMLSFGNFINYIAKMFLRVLKSEAGIFLTLVCVIMLSVIFENIADVNSSTGIKSAVSAVSGICMVILISGSVNFSLTEIEKSISQITEFCSALSPVMAGLIVSSGNISYATLSSSSLFVVCQIGSVYIKYFALPVVNILFALSVCQSVTDGMNLSGITEFVKKICKTAAVIALTAFSGIMSLQSILLKTNDSMTKSGIKTAVSTFVPVAGSAVSEGLDTVYSCAAAAKSVVGTAGILVIVFTFAVPVVTASVKYLIMRAGYTAATLNGNSGISTLLMNLSDIYGILIFLTLLAVLFFIVALALLIVG